MHMHKETTQTHTYQTYEHHPYTHYTDEYTQTTDTIHYTHRDHTQIYTHTHKYSTDAQISHTHTVPHTLLYGFKTLHRDTQRDCIATCIHTNTLQIYKQTTGTQTHTHRPNTNCIRNSLWDFVSLCLLYPNICPVCTIVIISFTSHLLLLASSLHPTLSQIGNTSSLPSISLSNHQHKTVAINEKDITVCQSLANGLKLYIRHSSF